MTGWIAENMASVAAALVLAVIVYFLIIGKIKARKDGDCGCGCGCPGCSGSCPHTVHTIEKTEQERDNETK